MARKESVIKIDAAPDGSGGYTFHMKGDEVAPNGARQKLVFDKKAKKMPKADDHKILFKLDGGKDKVRFTTSLGNVLWVKKVDTADDPCPDCAAHLPGEFFAYKVNDDQDELSIVNTNMDVELLAFRLNFVPKGKLDVPPDQYFGYDPITQNQDGEFP